MLYSLSDPGEVSGIPSYFSYRLSTLYWTAARSQWMSRDVRVANVGRSVHVLD